MSGLGPSCAAHWETLSLHCPLFPGQPGGSRRNPSQARVSTRLGHGSANRQHTGPVYSSKRSAVLSLSLSSLSLSLSLSSLSLCLTLLPFCSRRFPSCLEVVRLPEGHRTRHERHLAVSRVPVQLSSGSSVGGGSRAGASAALACSQTCSEPNQRHLDC